jgi:hypothetical protein
LCKEYRSLSSSLYSFLHSPVTSFLLRPKHSPHILFSDTLTLRSFLNVSNQVSHPQETTGKIIFLYILIVFFPDPQYSSNDSLIKKKVKIKCPGKYSNCLRLVIFISAVMILTKYHQLSPNSPKLKSIIYLYLIPNFT